jgi:hypothetical protein
MTKRRWTLLTAAILLVGGLTVLDAYRRLHDAGAGARDALLSAMPADASVVVFADFAALRQAPFATDLYNWIPKGQIDAEYADFLRATGFDYERDLDLIAVAVVNTEKESKLFATAKGRFDRKKIEAYAGRPGTRESRSGHEIISVPVVDGTRRISFAFLSDERIAFSDADLGPFLAPVPNGTDARQWRERFARLAGSPLFAVIRQDAAAGSALASRTPGGFQSPELSTLINQLQWITLAGKPMDRGMRIVAEGESSSEQTARQLSDLLSGMLLLAQAGLNGPETRRGLDPRLRDAYLEMTKSADVSHLDRGGTKSVRMVFDVTSNFLNAVTAAAPALPAPVAPSTPAAKKPVPKVRSQKPVRN